MTSDKPSRADALADAAIEVIASDGLRGLTHRAVETRAGLPAGSTSYYFPSRSALVRGVLARLLDLDWQDFETFGVVSLPASRSELVRASTRLFVHLSTAGRQRQVARYALYLDGEPDAERRALLDQATAALEARSMALVKELGSRRPRRDARLLMALLDGLLYDHVARPPVSPAEIRRRIAVVLDAVLPPQAAG